MASEVTCILTSIGVVLALEASPPQPVPAPPCQETFRLVTLGGGDFTTIIVNDCQEKLAPDQKSN